VKLHVGVRAIGEVLGVSVPTVRRMWRDDGLPLIKLRRPQGPGRSNWAWSTSDALLNAWMLSKAKVDREQTLSDRSPDRAAVQLAGETATG
jgi:hypothetical protein